MLARRFPTLNICLVSQGLDGVTKRAMRRLGVEYWISVRIMSYHGASSLVNFVD